LSDGGFQWKEEHEGIMLNHRYQLIEKIGAGVFGVAVLALDTKSQSPCSGGELVVIKINNSQKRFSKVALKEMQMLRYLNDKDRLNESNIVRVKSNFTFNNVDVGPHECVVFERLGLNLYEALENTNFEGFPLSSVRQMSTQLLAALSFLSDAGVIHGDIKPENVCLCGEGSGELLRLKLIDFGSSVHEYVYSRSMYRKQLYVQSRYYRSPEVLLSHRPCGVAMDMWSVGCVLFEMYTGNVLFPGVNAVDQIRKILAIKGLPPNGMIESYESEKEARYENVNNLNHGGGGSMMVPALFKMEEPSLWSLYSRGNMMGPICGGASVTEEGARKWTSTEPHLVSSEDLFDLLEQQKRSVRNSSGMKDDDYEEDLKQFHDLLMKMLEYDPFKRITPKNALQHLFVTTQKYQDRDTQASAFSSSSLSSSLSSTSTSTSRPLPHERDGTMLPFNTPITGADVTRGITQPPPPPSLLLLIRSPRSAFRVVVRTGKSTTTDEDTSDAIRLLQTTRRRTPTTDTLPLPSSSSSSSSTSSFRLLPLAQHYRSSTRQAMHRVLFECHAQGRRGRRRGGKFNKEEGEKRKKKTLLKEDANHYHHRRSPCKRRNNVQQRHPVHA
jgi:dual specificity tyrosine-phosphorylation-regulated kinase 1